MKLTNKSKQLIKYFSNNLNYVEQTRKTDSILVSLYNDIYNSYVYKNANLTYKTAIKHVADSSRVIMPITFKQDSFPAEIINHIFNKSATELTYEFSIFKRDVKVIFILEERAQKAAIRIEDYNKYVEIIYMWLFILNKYSSAECSASLTVYFYFTSLEKKLPSSTNHILGENNANTAFTRSCQANAEIVIFRKEDWLKVFFHETCHSFGLDFSDMNTDECSQHILRIFKVKSDVNLFEAYSEFWAEIMNSLFYSFFSLKNKADVNEFLDNAETLINYERTYSFFQLVKVLGFMGLTYKDLYANNAKSEKLYKENANILSYYVIKTILLNNYQTFLAWCATNNSSLLAFKKTLVNQREFCRFIEGTYKNKSMLDGVYAAEQFMKSKQQTSNSRSNNYLLTNMKMNIIESTFGKG